jgi:uroporphyrin-III C-methyltransferase/precorrin-2 dehydrogenase/sirohydrochlorin ferrochelatase
VALRKIEGLLSEGARVTVVAVDPAEAVSRLASQNNITLKQREFLTEDVEGFDLVFAATDSSQVNQTIFESANRHGIWVNVVDSPEQCGFHLPSRLQRGPLQVIVASGGDAPFVVRRLRQLLERLFGQEWSEWIEAAADFRRKVHSRNLTAAREQECFDRFFNGTVDQDRFVVRIPSRAEQNRWLYEGEKKLVEIDSQTFPAKSPTSVGFVSLVGAGPGDAGLLTVRGLRRLQTADAVVYDHLAETVLPPEISPDVELHPVGKKAGYHPVPQSEINELLVRLAGKGLRVVRLKGGDPFVFGRGGEEAEALARNGIPFEVVPCVTAGVAVPAYAGIPVTQRKEVVRLTLLTAHESAKKDGPQVRWDLLAQDRASTLVGYMSVTSLPQVVHNLLSYAMDPQTPAAMIEKGTTSRQRIVRSPVKDLPAAVLKAGIKPPAVFVIGPSVKHSDRLDWFTGKPLFGQRLLISSSLITEVEALEIAGAEVVGFTVPITPATRIVIDALPITGCVLSNVIDVEVLDEERIRPGWGNKVIAWCLTEESYRKADRLGWRNIIRVEPSVSGGTDLVEFMNERLQPTASGVWRQGGERL